MDEIFADGSFQVGLPPAPVAAPPPLPCGPGHGHRPPQQLYPLLVARVRGEEVRRRLRRPLPHAPPPLGHPRPECDGLTGVRAGVGRQEEPHPVRLSLHPTGVGLAHEDVDAAAEEAAENGRRHRGRHHSAQEGQGEGDDDVLEKISFSSLRSA